MLFKKTFLLLSFISICIFANSETITSERGHYQLNFETTYTTYVNVDIEMMITFPDGYKIASSVVGARDYIFAGKLENNHNTLYVTQVSEGSFSTNLAIHVITPEGVEERVIFKIFSKRKSPKVYAIHFDAPNSSELNRTIEAIKARYNNQMSKALSEQEKILYKDFHNETVCKGEAWFVKRRRGKHKIEHKGALAKFWGMYNSRQDTYLYIKADVAQNGCDIIKILSAGIKKELMEAELVCPAYELEDGGYLYVYKIPEIRPIIKRGKGKRQKLRIKYQIWSKTFIQKIKIS